MDRQDASRGSHYSPSASYEGRQHPTLAGKSERAVPRLSTGDALGNDCDDEQEDGSGLSDYSPREYNPANSGHFDSGEERSRSPTSPRYSHSGSCHDVSNYSPCEERYDGTPDHALRKARRPVKRQGSSKTDTADGSMDLQPANEKTTKNIATRGTPGTHPDGAVDIQPDGGLNGCDLWARGRNPATRKHKRKRASAELVQCLITQNHSLSERLGKVETALALMQSQIRLYEKPETSATGIHNAQIQHGSVATENSETEMTESVLQSERLKLARDICMIVCLVAVIIVLLKLPRLLDAVVCLVDQNTESLRFEHLVKRNAGQQHLI